MEMGLSRFELAEILGIPYKYVAGIEADEIQPTEALRRVIEVNLQLNIVRES